RAADVHAAQVAQLGRAGLVEADEVAQDQIVVAVQLDAVGGVAGDDVAGPGRRAADDVAAGAGVDEHADVAVAHGCGTAGVGADVVAFDQVSRRAASADHDPVLLVAADDVAGRGRGAAERIIAGAARDVDAVARVRECGRAGDIRADGVAGHDV